MLLQKVKDRAYVRSKINWMYKQANISIPTNRLGLAKAIGLVIRFYGVFIFCISCCIYDLIVFCCLQVAASHLDTVLDKLKDILDNVGQSIFQRFMLVLFGDFLLFFFGFSRISPLSPPEHEPSLFSLAWDF